MASNAGTRIIRVAFWGIVYQIGSVYGHDVGPHRHLYMLRLPKGPDPHPSWMLKTHTTQEQMHDMKSGLHRPSFMYLWVLEIQANLWITPTLSRAVYESYLLCAISVPLGHLSKSLSTQSDINCQRSSRPRNLALKTQCGTSPYPEGP